MNIQKRLGIEIEATRQLREVGGFWTVAKAANRFSFYRVDLKPNWECNCANFNRTRKWCRHIYAVRERLRKEDRLPRALRKPPAEKTCPRNWKKYNQGTSESHREFMKFLRQLCNQVQTPLASDMGGRPRCPWSDLCFAAVLKVRQQRASREMKSILDDEKELKRIQHIAGRNTILNFFQDREASGVLNRMIERCCRPFQKLETCFAFDSTHYDMPRRKDPVYDPKTGNVVAKKMNFMAHVAVGIETHIIAGVTATPNEGKEISDPAQFPWVLKQTAKRFRVREVLADSAYNTDANYRMVRDVQGTLYTENTARHKGIGRGPNSDAYREGYFFQKEHPGAFYKVYKKRKNVESAHSQAKRKITFSLFSKTDKAATNEVLCIALIHNILCLAMAKFERALKIEL